MTWVSEHLADSPSAFIRLGERAGTSAADAIGGAAGTYNGGVTLGQTTLVPSDPDPAASFDGTNDYVTFAHRAAFDIGNRWTVKLRVRPTSYRDAGGLGGTMVDFGSGSLIIRFGDALDGSWIVRRNSVATVATSTGRIPLNAVTEIAVSWDGTTLRMEQAGANVTGRVTSTTFVNNALPFCIGAADGGSGNFFTGTLDEVVVFAGAALSAARTAAHLAAATTIPLEGATETDAAPAVAVAPGAVTIPLDIATETDGAPAPTLVPGTLTVPLEVVTETDSAPGLDIGVGAGPAPSSVRSTPLPERIAHQALAVRVRQISRCLSSDPGAVSVLGKYYRGDWEINGELGWQTGSFDRCIGEEQEFTLTLPNGPGADGRLHRDRVAIIAGGRARPLPGGVVEYSGGTYRPGDEWFEIYDDEQGDDPAYVGTPTKAIVDRSSIQLSGWCGFWRLKKTREFQAGFWADAPRDVIEHYTGIWDCLYADDMRAVNSRRVSKNTTFANGVATLAPSAVGSGQNDSAYVVAADRASFTFTPDDPVRAEAVVNVPAIASAPTTSYARFIVSYHTVLDDLGTAQIDINPQTGEVTCKVFAEALVSKPGVKLTLGVDIALAIEIRYGWVYFYVDGTLVAVLPWSESNATYIGGRPKVVRVAETGIALASQTMRVRSIVWRVMRRFLLRGADKGDLRLPGQPTSGGLLGYYFDGADELAKFPPGGGDINSLAYRLMRAPTKQPAAIRRDPVLDFVSAGVPTWQPSGVGGAFAARWVGAIYLDFVALGDVRLRVTADDHARVFVGRTLGGPLFEGRWDVSAGVATSSSLSASLATNVTGWYPIVVEFLQAGGATKLLLEYEAATNPGVWVAVPATMLSPYGCYVGQVRNDSHYDTLKSVADSFGYQLTCKPYSLESGKFPGQLVPRVREGVDYDKALREDEAIDLSDAIDAEGVCDAIMADAAGVADPKGTAQLTGEMLNYDEITEHLGVLTEYETLAEITQPELLEQRLASLLALSAAPWEEVSARAPGFHELLDRWPLPPTSSPGTPELFKWNPGDAPRLELPSLGVIDRGPRQIMRVSRQFSRAGLKPPLGSFRQRPRSYKDLFRQLRRAALQPQRNYQGTLVAWSGSHGSSAGAGGVDAFSRVQCPSDRGRVAKVVVEVQRKDDATAWALEVNGVVVHDITSVGPYDLTPYAATFNAVSTFMAARLVARAGSTGGWVIQLILTLRQ